MSQSRSVGSICIAVSASLALLGCATAPTPPSPPPSGPLTSAPPSPPSSVPPTSVTISSLVVPKIDVATVTIPDIRVPAINVPAINVPEVKVAAPDLSQIKFPSITLPPVTMAQGPINIKAVLEMPNEPLRIAISEKPLTRVATEEAVKSGVDAVFKIFSNDKIPPAVKEKLATAVILQLGASPQAAPDLTGVERKLEAILGEIRKPTPTPRIVVELSQEWFYILVTALGSIAVSILGFIFKPLINALAMRRNVANS